MQISLLTKEKKFLLKRLQHMSKGHSISARKDIEDGNKSFPVSRNDLSSGTSLKETNSDATGPSNTSHEVGFLFFTLYLVAFDARNLKAECTLVSHSQLKERIVIYEDFVLP